MKNIRFDMKNILNGINRILYMVDENISKFEDRVIYIYIKQWRFLDWIKK